MPDVPQIRQVWKRIPCEGDGADKRSERRVESLGCIYGSTSRQIRNRRARQSARRAADASRAEMGFARREVAEKRSDRSVGLLMHVSGTTLTRIRDRGAPLKCKTSRRRAECGNGSHIEGKLPMIVLTATLASLGTRLATHRGGFAIAALTKTPGVSQICQV
jgi:hypothetical protein